MKDNKIQALLFDLGGVLIEIDFTRAFEHWQMISTFPLEELSARFAFDDAYQQHERGEITASQYFRHLSATLQLQSDEAHIAAGWNAIFTDEITETRCLVQTARRNKPC